MDLGRSPNSDSAPDSNRNTRTSNNSSTSSSTNDILSAIASMNVTGGGPREGGYPQEMIPFPGMLPMGGPEFTLPFDFFFSGFQCLEPLAGGSTVAIDNKIEQAMDLVKRHLMYAVREEVEILKQQIGEMMERIGQLEYENTVLRAEAKPETLNKLLLPRVTQTQPTSALPAPTSAAPAPQQGQQATNTQAPSNHNAQNATPQSQTQIHVQQPAQPAPQQQVQSTPASQATHAPQAGHPPST